MNANITATINKAALKIKKHSPEILAITGAGLTIGGTIMACKATLKVNDIMDETKETVDKIHKVVSGEIEVSAEYTEEDSKKDLTITYIQTGVKIAKLYAPAVITIGLGIGCMFGSNHILRKRNVALGAAYATLDKGYKEYRNRVVERFGEKVDQELKYNIKAQKVTETVVDEETGKEKKIKTIKNYINPDEMSEYARFFEYQTRDEHGNVIPNLHWNNSNEYNVLFLKNTQTHANDLLKARGHLFLNEVYDMLGLPRSKAGQVVGWVYNEKNPVGDNYVDFGMFSDPDSYSDYIYGNDPAILLDFNVDGVIWDLI